MKNKIENPEKSEFRNAVRAMLLTTVILFGFNYFFGTKPTQQVAEEAKTQPTSVVEQVVVETPQIVENQPKAEPVLFENEYLKTMFNPAVGGFNDASLLKYKETLDEKSPFVSVLNPDYFTSLMWVSKDVQMPTINAYWQKDETSSTDKKQVFVYQNEAVQIKREVSLDDKYMLTLTDTVTNLKAEPIKAYQQGFISRKIEAQPQVSTVHQGFVGYLNNELVEEKYDEDEKIFSGRTTSGWLGFTDKYWQSLMVLDKNDSVSTSFTFDKGIYKAEFETDNIVIQPQTSVSKTLHLFVGAKDIDVINAYQKDLNINHFDLSIDFGWFRFLTQPFLHFLNYLYGLIGNMGVAILIFATFIRLLLLPIATKSYESMAKMRKVQPKMKVLQNRFKQDPRRLQIEMANLYRREKINPASGCLPLLLQIPVFFALYKVLSISINMRQAPFFGWIQDLSMPDPLSVFNAFGYFDFNLPAFLTIGVWPILMGITMYVQQKLSPAPADKTQARVMQFLPIIFTLMMASFASGLIIYWTWSNILSIFQQKYIMKKVGVE